MTTENTWATKNSKELRLDSDGAWYAVTETRVPVNPTKTLESFVKEQGWLTPMLGPGTYVYFKGTSKVLMQTIETIPFKIAMVMEKSSIPATKDSKESIRYLPAFNGPGLEVDPPFMYTPPKDMRLIFCAALKAGKTGVIPFLFAQCKDTGNVHHPILPNVYDNGKLCLGEDFARPAYNMKLGLDQFLTGFFKAWSETKWNSDLAGSNGARPCEWLKFEEKTKQNVIPDVVTSHWKTFAGATIVPPIEYAEALGSLHSELAPAGL